MTFQVISSDETKIENLPACEIFRTKDTIKVLFNSKQLSSGARQMLETDGLFISTHPSQDTIKTITQFATTSAIDGGSSMALSEDQWLVTFDLAEQKGKL